MSESIKHEMERSFDRIEPDPGAKERMLANVRRKAAEPVPDTGKTETPLVEPSCKSNKLLRFGLPVAACLVLGVIGVTAIPRSPQPIGESDETVLNSQEETPVESQTVHVEVPTTPNSSNTSKTVTIPAPEMGSKPRLSECSDSELMKYMLEQEVDFGAAEDPAHNEKAITQTRENVREIERDPYGFQPRAVSYTAIGTAAETYRRAVCRYYGWPYVRLITELSTDAGRIIPEFQMWSLQKDFFGRDAHTTETGVRMTFIAPSVRPNSGDFRRKMVIYLEPEDVIETVEAAEAPGSKRTDLAFELSWNGTAVVYDLGNHAYDVYLYLEDGRSALMIEASVTEDELKDMLQNCRFFETAG